MEVFAISIMLKGITSTNRFTLSQTAALSAVKFNSIIASSLKHYRHFSAPWITLLCMSTGDNI